MSGKGGQQDASGGSGSPVPGPNDPSGPRVPVVPIQRVVPVSPAIPATSAVPPPATVALPDPGPPSRRRPSTWIVVGVVTVVIAVAAGFGAYFGTRAGQPSATDLAPVDPGTAAAATDPSSASGRASDGPTATTSPPPVLDGGSPSSPGSTVPASSAVLLRDDVHAVVLRAPAGMVEDHRFDGTQASWHRGGVRLTYRVVSGSTLSDAAQREGTLLGALTVSYHPTPDVRTDGRYLVAGHSGQTSVYERGRIRCGDLVWYRFEWPSSSAPDIAFQGAAATALISRDPTLDSMGGDHASCAD